MPKYDLIVEYLKAFEQALDDNHELAFKFTEYGDAYVLLSTHNGKDKFIAFELLSSSGECFAVIQSYSQLNFAIVSKLKPDTQKEARRVGFKID